MREEIIILVDGEDKQIGTGEKMEVHRAGLLHRAFSVFVFNSKGETLLQQRALGKYHSAGLWTNTCCSHPRVGENTLVGAKRRLKEEMGIVCELEEIDSFVYKTEFEGLFEHEFDHIFVGRYEGNPIINKSEVESFLWISLAELKRDIEENPNKYTSWFKIALKRTDFSKIV